MKIDVKSKANSIVYTGLITFVLSYILGLTFGTIYTIAGIGSEIGGSIVFRVTLIVSVASFSIFFYRTEAFKTLGLNFTTPLYFFIGIVVTILYFPIDIVLQSGYISNHRNFETILEALDNYLMRWGSGDNVFWILLISSLILAPVSEELLFRGLLQSSLETTRLGKIGSMIAVSAIWTADHISGVDTIGLASIFIFGVVLSYLRRKTNSIIPSILAHSLINCFWLIVWVLRMK